MNDIMTVPSAYYWVSEAPDVIFPPLSEPPSVDVVVIGAGIVGLTTALRLKQAGRRVAVIEAKRVGEQTTGGSTAKISSQHQLIYDYLIRTFGRSHAGLYAECNQQAITGIRDTAASLGIACDFQTRAAYAYTRQSKRIKTIEREAQAALDLGLPAQFLQGDIGLPYPVAAAMRFDDQAQFQPVTYLKGLAQAIDGDGSVVLEQTRAINVDEGQPCAVRTERGSVQAADVVVATHLPILDRSGFFARASPRAHIGLAARLDREPPQSMYISVDEPTHSFRVAHDEQGPVLIVIGHAFQPGNVEVATLYRELADFTRQHFPVTAFEKRWMNMDYNSVDRVPYVGRMPPLSKHLYVATGFSAWGLTNGHVAGQLLADTITGKPNPYAGLFDAGRLKPLASAKEFISHNLQTAHDFVVDHLRPVPKTRPGELAAGEGGIFSIGHSKVAAYRDEQGQLHTLSPLCTHLGCSVVWNAAEKSWDCPCHGSRFGYDGQVIHGPAVKPMLKKPV